MNGPITYDLVSLLQDCYISWPREKVVQWIEQFRHYAMEAKTNYSNYYGETLDQFLRWFDLTGVQRHLKNLGIFSRLHYRDGKSHYLSDLAMPFKYVREACERYEELADLKELMKLFEQEAILRSKIFQQQNPCATQEQSRCAP